MPSNDEPRTSGSKIVANASRGILYAGGVMRDLGLLPGAERSVATTINNPGQVVGHMGFDDGEGAFLYEDGRMRDLNELVPPDGWTLLEARDVNDRGQIVGVGTLDGEPHGFLLTPLDGGAVIPLPPAVWPALGTLAFAGPRRGGASRLQRACAA